MTQAELHQAFTERFGTEPELLAIAPGRINLIGEHTDYNDGFVFPAAIDRSIYVAARRTEGPSRVTSAQIGDGEPFDASTVNPGDVKGWAAYPAGMAWVLRTASGCEVPNVEAFLYSTLPMGSGVSSSAALELAFGVLWNRLANLGFDNKELARLGQRSENQFVGVNCGIMDQMASAMGKEGSAMFLDTRSLDIAYAPIPDNLLIVLCDTKKPRALTDSAYNERRGQCEQAAEILGVRALRDATVQLLEAKRSEMPEVVYRRARHVVTEDARSQAFREALEKSDEPEIGRLMKESHVSLRDDYEVSCRELDFMAEAAWQAPGCVGARMTGAGFGGACVALVRKNEIEAFSASTAEAYRRSTELEGSLLVCKPVEGARIWV